MSMDDEELLVNRAYHNDKGFLKRYMENPKEELGKLKRKKIINNLQELSRANVELSRNNLYSKIKQNGDYSNGIILIKLLNSLKSECSNFESDTKTIEEIYKQADTIMNLAKVIENFEELQPTLSKYFYDKSRENKFKNNEELEK